MLKTCTLYIPLCNNIICRKGYSYRLLLNCGNSLMRVSLISPSVVFTFNVIFTAAFFLSSLFDDVTNSLEYTRNVFRKGLFPPTLPSSSSEVEVRLQAPPFLLVPIVTEKMQRKNIIDNEAKTISVILQGNIPQLMIIRKMLIHH